MIEQNSEVYVNASEAARLLKVNRPRFYRNIVGALTSHRVPTYRRKFYKQSEVLNVLQQEGK